MKAIQPNGTTHWYLTCTTQERLAYIQQQARMGIAMLCEEQDGRTILTHARIDDCRHIGTYGVYNGEAVPRYARKDA